MRTDTPAATPRSPATAPPAGPPAGSPNGSGQGSGRNSGRGSGATNPKGGARDVGNVGRNMVATIVGNLYPPLALLVTAPVLAHTLDVTGRGEVAGATAPLFFVATAATVGAPQAVNYAIAKSPAVLRRAVRHATEITVVAGLIATLAVILAADWLGGNDAKMPRLIVVAGLAILPTLLLTMMRGVASGLHRWNWVATERLISSAAELAAIVALAVFHGLTPLTATIVLAFSPMTGVLPYLRAFRHAPEVPDLVDPLGSRSHIFNYGMQVWIGSLSGIILSRIDQTIMTPLASAYQLGIYASAVTVSQIPSIVNNAVRDVTFSADATTTMDERLGTSSRISSAVSAVIGLVVGVSGIWWIPIFFGHNFAPVVPVAAVLIVAVVVGTPGSIAGAGLSARGRPGLRSASLVVACIVNLALVLVLVPPYGAMGAAIATLVGNLFSANGCVYLLWRVGGVHPRDLHGLRRDDVVRMRRYARSTWRGVMRNRTRRRPARRATVGRHRA